MSKAPTHLPNRATLSPSLNWLRVLWMTFITPSTSSFEFLINEPTASINAGCLWMTASSILAALLAAFPASQNLSFVFAFLAGIPLIFLPSLLILFIGTQSTLWIGYRLGGTANYSKMFYGLAIIFAPINVLAVASYFVPYRLWFLLLLSMYWTSLSILCVRTVHQFTSKKAFLSSIVFLIVVILRLVLDFVLLSPA